MTVLLVLAVFAAFIALDIGLQTLRRHRAAGADVGAKDGLAAPAPDSFAIHDRHTWARVVDPVTVAVGIDDVGSRLVGRATGFVLPLPGAHVRAGERGFRVRSGDRVADVVAPVDGTVVGINRALDDDPDLCVRRPWDDGWLCRVRVADAVQSVARLRRGRDASDYLKAERRRLSDAISTATNARLAADGGEPVADVGAHLDRETWDLLVHDFLAPVPRRHTHEEEL